MSHARFASVALLLGSSCRGTALSSDSSNPPAVVAPAATSPAAAPASGTATALAASAPPPFSARVSITLKNALAAPRAAHTIAVRLSEVEQLSLGLQISKAVVQDAKGAALLSQLVDTDGDEQPDELVFQTDFAANESKTFLLGEGLRSPPSREQYRVYGRFVRERHDDFAWENDRAAHRMYGPDLEAWKKDPLVSSGVDVWLKRTPRLVVNEWYQSDDYHRDNGDGGDFYSVGQSRGCGGLGIWDGKRLHVSRNFTRSRVLANGPIRLIFELSYAPWNVGDGSQISETKRVIVDAGQYFDRFESTFTVQGRPRHPSLALGIAKHSGVAFEGDESNAILRSWEPLSGDNGHLGCAVLAASGAASGFAEISTDHLLLVPLPNGGAVTYFVGVGWDKNHDALDNARWAALVSQQAQASRSPVVVLLAPTSGGSTN